MKRDEIINKIIETAKNSNCINAGWELGALAFDRVDEYSDIDLVFDVEPKCFDSAFTIIEKCLNEISPIETKLGSPNGIAEGAYQYVYKLEGLSEFLIIEICFIPSTTLNKSIEKEIHGNVLIHFDKKGICNQSIDLTQFTKTMEERFEKIKKIYNMYQFAVKKEIHRNNPTEAYFYYFSVALNPFIELIRMRYNPFHYNFRHRYVYYELPSHIAQEIEDFTFIKDIDDLANKHSTMIERFKEEIDYLDSLDFKEHLNKYKS